MPPDRPVLLTNDDQVAVASGDAGQHRTGIALGRPDGYSHVVRLAAGRGPERVADQLRRRVTLLGSPEEDDNARMREVPVTAPAVPGQSQCP
jgi:hypothetical protein